MSNKSGPLQIVICDDGYQVFSNGGQAKYTLSGIPLIKFGVTDSLPERLLISDRRSVTVKTEVKTEECSDRNEHSPITLADCKARFGDSETIPFGGFPMPKRKVLIHVSGLQQWKYGIVSGAEVRVDIIQNGKCIHSEVFSGKATQPFTREIEISASFDDIVAVHNRPDLNELKVSAEFAGVTCNEESAAKRLTNIMSEHIRKVLIKESQPGGLLHKR